MIIINDHISDNSIQININKNSIQINFIFFVHCNIATVHTHTGHSGFTFT